MYHDILIAGFGGQGVLFMGNLLAQAAMEEGLHVTFMPSYGVEMRGGTANCSVILSAEEIGSPITDNPLSGVMMNEASLGRFMNTIRSGGSLFYNSSLVPANKANRSDVQLLAVPANDIAKQVGSDQVASLVMIACFVGWTNLLPASSLPKAMVSLLSPKARAKLLDLNLAALEQGFSLAEHLKKESPPKPNPCNPDGFHR